LTLREANERSTLKLTGPPPNTGRNYTKSASAAPVEPFVRRILLTSQHKLVRPSNGINAHSAATGAQIIFSVLTMALLVGDDHPIERNVNIELYRHAVVASLMLHLKTVGSLVERVEVRTV
jgi:hypothetical protein